MMALEKGWSGVVHGLPFAVPAQAKRRRHWRARSGRERIQVSKRGWVARDLDGEMYLSRRSHAGDAVAETLA